MYRIREAADRAGVSSELLRAWERRYGIVSPRRTASGYRVYDDAAIRRVRAMRALVDQGWSPSTAAESLRDVTDDDLPDTRSRPDAATTPPDDDLVAQFVEAAAVLDGAGMRAVLDEMGSRGSFEQVVERYLFPALRAIGDGWAQARLSVAAEHAASGSVHRWLAAAFEAAATDDRRAPVLVGLPAGARHELGALAFATAVRRAGVSVRYLGADLPAADWVAAARATGAPAAVIAVPTDDDADAARRTATALRRASPDVAVLFGGRGAGSMARASVLAGSLGESAHDLATALAGRSM